MWATASRLPSRLSHTIIPAPSNRSRARRLEWEAEPNATGFYERMGGTYVRDSEVTEWGRVLEVLGVALT